MMSTIQVIAVAVQNIRSIRFFDLGSATSCHSLGSRRAFNDLRFAEKRKRLHTESKWRGSSFKQSRYNVRARRQD
jgi:hypothetical protein